MNTAKDESKFYALRCHHACVQKLMVANHSVVVKDLMAPIDLMCSLADLDLKLLSKVTHGFVKTQINTFLSNIKNI